VYVTSSLEYETIWAMGGMLGIADLDVIARLDFLCDDIGLDTMNTGVAMAVAMDSGYRPFGDAKAALDMVEEIAQGTPFGRILGSGPAAVGRHFGNPRVPAVKGQSVAAYDPRAMLGQGVTFSTSPMGADHTAGNMVGMYLGRELDPLKTEGQVAGSRRLQIAMAAFDCAGLCFMASAGLSSPEAREALRKLLSARFGTPFEPGDFPDRMGTRILKAEQDFNRRAGLTRRDDRLPRFYYEEPLPPHNTVFTIGGAELDATLDLGDEAP
jgi:aldehyde:ferredoxin oxidoreductase